jgi:hypothetical protein
VADYHYIASEEGFVGGFDVDVDQVNDP